MAYILIVDSQAEFRQQLVRRLEQAGHRATAVATISEASTLVEADAPDLLATDAVLIDGSSGTLVKQAEAVGAKVLMMTEAPIGLWSWTARVRHISKPFTPEAFLERVRDMLGEG
jgi:DNA-binding response OmpR family regulator